MAWKQLPAVLLFGSLTLQPAWAQIPSNPPEEDTARAGVIEGHRPGSGFLLINTQIGTLTFSASASIRYLNQKGLDDTYTNAFGRTSLIDQRNDLQYQKLMLYFKGWLFIPKLRYVTYVWTANTSQGQGAQVVLGGNFQYNINRRLDPGIGIGGLPTNRSLTGNWPFWLRQDARPMGEEFSGGRLPL